MVGRPVGNTDVINNVMTTSVTCIITFGQNKYHHECVCDNNAFFVEIMSTFKGDKKLF